MKILIDNGHGENTPGKRSPDGKFREYSYAREIAKSIEGELKFLGIDAERIVTESEDIPLEERVRRVNEICGRFGAEMWYLFPFIATHRKTVNGARPVVGVPIQAKAKPRAMNLPPCCMPKRKRILPDLQSVRIYRTVTLTGKKLSISCAKQNALQSLRKTFSWTMSRM